MLDVRYIREHPDDVARALETRGGAESVQRLLALDAERRRRVTAVEALKAERNKVTGQIAQAKRRGESPTGEMARMRTPALGENPLASGWSSRNPIVDQ